MGKAIFPCGCEFELTETDRDDIHVEWLDNNLPRLKLDIYNIPLNCPATWDLLGKGNILGIFQLEGYLGKIWSKRLRPVDLEFQSALMALLRPGCIKSKSGDPPKSMTERYVDRRHHREEVDFFGVSELKPILGKTYGILVYQEQAMQIAVTLGGFNEQQADILRKAIGKKKPDIMAKVEKEFIEGCARVGIVTKEKAEEIFNWIRESQAYSFNRSHAMCYGMNSYWSAYCKAHFPMQFYCSYLRGTDWKQDKYQEVENLVADAKLSGIEIRLPDFRDLKDHFYIKNDDLYFGLLDVRQIGDAAIEKIKIQVREAELLLDKKLRDWNWLDYLIYFSSRTSTTVNTSLIYSGALDYLGIGRSQMIFEHERWIMLTEKEQLWIYSSQYAQFNDLPEGAVPWKGPRWTELSDIISDCKKTKKEGGGCHNKKRSQILDSIEQQLRNPPHRLQDTSDMIVWAEERYLGSAITSNIVDSCDESFQSNRTCLEMKQSRIPYATLAVEILQSREYRTKKGTNPGRKMAFLIARDSTCTLEDVVCFPDAWRTYKDLLQPTNCVLLQVEKIKGGSLSVRKVAQI